MRCGNAPVNRLWNGANSEEPQPQAPVKASGEHQLRDLPARMHTVDSGLCASVKAGPAEGSR